MCFMPSAACPYAKQVALNIVTTVTRAAQAHMQLTWVCHAHNPAVQVLLFAEELASVVLTPFILAFSLPNCAGNLGYCWFVLFT
jgi:hypothetical protein